jgi:hypothetical protein
MNKSKEELVNELTHYINTDIMLWGRYYCSNHFRLKSPGFHFKILKCGTSFKFFAVAAPRESAKSTIISFLRPLHAIYHKKKRFIVIVQNTWEKACGSLDTIKKEVLNNNLLKTNYKIEITRDAKGDSIFTHDDGYETRVLCKGSEQIGSIRGEKFGAWRPDLIIGDDMEDDELVRNPERRKIFQEEFDDALIPAGDRELCEYNFVGTILHDDSQLAKLVSNEFYPEYRKLLFKSLVEKDNTYHSLWKEKWSVDYLLNMRNNKPTTFAKEMQNDPVSGLLKKFHKEDFRYWSLKKSFCFLLNEEGKILHKYHLRDCKAAIACDLAWEEKKSSDYSVIFPAFLTPSSDILLEDYICKKGLRPHEIEEILFTMEERLRTLTGTSVPIGFEKAKLEKVIKHLLRAAMSRRNKWLVFKDLQWDKDKNERIVTRLEPRYAQHSIYHKRGMGDYEYQLLRVPSGVHDDLPDAAQGLCQLLQYPKGRKREVPQDDEFEWWRQQAIKYRKPKKEPFIFGKRRRTFLPTKIAYR